MRNEKKKDKESEVLKLLGKKFERPSTKTDKFRRKLGRSLKK